MPRPQNHIVITLLLVSLLVTACGGGLPEGAKKALDKVLETEAKTISTKQAKAPNFAGPLMGQVDEAWCVVTEQSYPFIYPSNQANHFILIRRQLLWEVYLGLLVNQPTTERDFLAAGCDNW